MLTLLVKFRLACAQTCPGRAHSCPGRAHPCPGRAHLCPGRPSPCPGRSRFVRDGVSPSYSLRCAVNGYLRSSCAFRPAHGAGWRRARPRPCRTSWSFRRTSSPKPSGCGKTKDERRARRGRRHSHALRAPSSATLGALVLGRATPVHAGRKRCRNGGIACSAIKWATTEDARGAARYDARAGVGSEGWGDQGGWRWSWRGGVRGDGVLRFCGVGGSNRGGATTRGQLGLRCRLKCAWRRAADAHRFR